jgi:hypothetical protein
MPEPATVADLVRRSGLQDRVKGPGEAEQPLPIPTQASDAPAVQR